MVGTSFNTYAIMAVHNLWKNNFEDAQSILVGYLYLKPKFDTLTETIRQENFKKNKYDLQDNDVFDKFVKENKRYIEKIKNNQTSIDDVGEIEKIDLYTLDTAFQLIPSGTNNKEHKIIANKIISTFFEKIFSNDRDDGVDLVIKRNFLKTLSYFVLMSPKDEIKDLLRPLLDKFNRSEIIADLLKAFITAEDSLNSYENFWEVWNLFKTKIIEACKNGDGYGHVNEIIRNYLFAINWKESAIEWHTLKDADRKFLKEMCEKIGHCPSTLYAISKLLNDIGSSFGDDGIIWISNILTKNKNLSDDKLDKNTEYYLENLVRKFIYKNRTKIKETKILKDNILVILDFLISNGSTVGYILRENVI
jgi:hypothetical protein